MVHGHILLSLDSKAVLGAIRRLGVCAVLRAEAALPSKARASGRDRCRTALYLLRTLAILSCITAMCVMRFAVAIDSAHLPAKAAPYASRALTSAVALVVSVLRGDQVVAFRRGAEAMGPTGAAQYFKHFAFP